MVKTELDQLVQAGVIAPETEATDWVHPTVVVLKPNVGIRLCIDLQKLNNYVRRPYHPSKSPAKAVLNISFCLNFSHHQTPLKDTGQ